MKSELAFFYHENHEAYEKIEIKSFYHACPDSVRIGENHEVHKKMKINFFTMPVPIAERIGEINKYKSLFLKL